MFPSKQKSIKSLFSIEDMKKVGKVISKFLLFNEIPFNVVDSGSYYQSMIDIIVEVGPSINKIPNWKYIFWGGGTKAWGIYNHNES